MHYFDITPSTNRRAPRCLVRALMISAGLMVLASMSPPAYAQYGPAAPYVSHSSPGSYSVSYLCPATACYLEEYTTSAGWQYVDASESEGPYGSGYASYQAKLPGTYQYRAIGLFYPGGYISYSPEVSVTIAGAPGPTPDTVETQEGYAYQTRAGDANGDGRMDLLVTRTSPGVTGDGSLSSFILLQGSSGAFSAGNYSASGALATGGSWPLVNLHIGVKDLNFDYFADITISGFGQIAGSASGLAAAKDTIVYAPAIPNQYSPQFVKTVDASFRGFATDFERWLASPTYFEDNAPVVSVPVYGWVFGCEWYWYDEIGWYQQCDYFWTYLGNQLVYDVSSFSAAAVQVRNIFASAGGPISSGQSGELTQILQGQYGAPFDLSRPVPFPNPPIDIPWPAPDTDVRSPWLLRLLLRVNWVLLVLQIPGDTPNPMFLHYTNAAGFSGISSTGLIVSASGVVFVTQDQYVSAAVARAKLALAQAPIGAFVLYGRYMPPVVGPTIVQSKSFPDGVMPGGGREYTTTSPVSIRSPLSPAGRFFRIGP